MFNKICDVGRRQLAEVAINAAAAAAAFNRRGEGEASRPISTKTNRRQRTVTALFHYRVK